MKNRLYFRAVEILIAVALVAAAVVLIPRTSEVYAAEAVFSDEKVSEEPEALADRDGSGLELNELQESDETDDASDYFIIKFKFVNKSATVARMYLHYDPDDKVVDKYWYTDSCAVGESDTVTMKMKKYDDHDGENFNVVVQDWCFGWFNEVVYNDTYFSYDKAAKEYTLTASGVLGDLSAEWDPEPESYDDALHVPATIKASPKTVKKGKKTTVKITSDSGAKLRAGASNKKAKSALKKKYVKIKAGKTAKITFTKKAPKGKYKFLVGSPANGKYKGTVKTITIKVK